MRACIPVSLCVCVCSYVRADVRVFVCVHSSPCARMLMRACRRASLPACVSDCARAPIYQSTTFFTCRVWMREPCRVWPWLSEHSGAALSCFTLSRLTYFQRYIAHPNQTTPSIRSLRLFFIHCHGSGTIIVNK